MSASPSCVTFRSAPDRARSKASIMIDESALNSGECETNTSTRVMLFEKFWEQHRAAARSYTNIILKLTLTLSISLLLKLELKLPFQASRSGPARSGKCCSHR